MHDIVDQPQRSLPGAAGPTIFNPQGPSPFQRPTGPTFPRPPFPMPEFPPSRPWL